MIQEPHKHRNSSKSLIRKFSPLQSFLFEKAKLILPQLKKNKCQNVTVLGQNVSKLCQNGDKRCPNHTHFRYLACLWHSLAQYCRSIAQSRHSLA